ncbi:MAG TPA: hypothetical protein VGD56_14075 [Gemmatirosa sp.]
MSAGELPGRTVALRANSGGREDNLPPVTGATGVPWKARVGSPPLIVLAYERPERRGLVFARWTDPARVGRDRGRKRSLGVTVRDTAGRLNLDLVAAAERKLRAFYTDVLAGRDPGSELSGDSGEIASDSGTASPLTLRDGYALALRCDGTGLYARATRQHQDAQSAADTAMDVLGHGARWTDVTPARAAEVWRTLARRHCNEGRSGPRHAEVVVSTLYTVARWLRDNAYLPADACRAERTWRMRLKAEWEKLTGRTVAPRRPRHTETERRAIVAALPDADPRLRLAVALGAGLRLGQVLRVMRGDVALERTAECPHGRVVVRGRGRKPGETVDLTAEQRAEVDDALAGYLREYEAAYTPTCQNVLAESSGASSRMRPAPSTHAADGRVTDYALFPGGKLARGIARLRSERRVLDRRSALGMFHHLERSSGVEPVAGRGWYGIRRRSTDLPPRTPATLA